ncbi:hypothetical protein M0R88_14770 [Halorussus gelatinilyticus]|uniref:Cell surface glycoprotein n=1 Tax=Halorussus gelatinilyticus TaxID=2937524 RepID=A0A8U0IFB8_9EURY|nr:hypothetical protein [Halorussus gelatinilyticus]UPV99769.1 hypothetical protein M0R88_14770 [Halorussus gelatinilyticus]
MSGAVLGADVQRGGQDPTFNPGVGGPNTVVASEEKPVVFQGEEDINFVQPNGRPIDPAQLVGVSGDAEGIPLESPIPEDQELGQYAVNGQRSNIGVTVQKPRVTDLEVFNERGIDVEGSTVQEDETLLVKADWNFQNAEDLSLEVTDENGNEITGDVLTNVESLSDAQLQELNGAYAQYPEKIDNPGQRGTGTGIEYLQGIGQFNNTQLETDNTSVQSAYWAIDLSDQNSGDYTITVEGWDTLNQESATRSTVVSVTGETNVALDLEGDEATRGQNVRYTVRGSTAGASHIVTIEDNDFRNNQVNENVFRDVEDVIDRGTLDTNNDGSSDLAWAQVEVNEDTGLGVGQIDTSYLDDTNVDVNLYQEGQNLTDIAQDEGDTEDDRTLNVVQGGLTFESPAGTYIAGQEVDARGTAAPGVDEVAIYVRDQGDWELADINEDGQLNQQDLINVDSDGEWEERDVTLSQASDVLSIPGRYRIGVVEGDDVVGQNGTVQEQLSTSEFSSATSDQTSIIVTEPTLGGINNSSMVASFGIGAPAAMQDGNNTTQDNQTAQDDQRIRQDTPVTNENPTWVFRTYNEQIAVEDGTVEVTGVAPGLEEVLVVMVDSRGRIVTETVSVDDNDVFEEDDIELINEEGRELNEGQITGMVIGLGRDTVVGDGVVPGQDQSDLAALENWIKSFSTGLTQDQVVARIIDETTGEAGSDDLRLRQSFRYADAATSVSAIVPQGEANVSSQPGLQSRIVPIEAGQTMVVEGVTNRKPDDNTITVEVINGPSAEEFDSAAVDQWGRNGIWSVNLSTEGIQPGTYTMEIDDGDNTDIVQFQVVEQSQQEGQQDGQQNETTTTTVENETDAGADETTTTTTEGNETTAAGNETTEVANETDAAAGNQTQGEAQAGNTLEIRSEGTPLNYSVSFAGTVEAVGNQTEESDSIQDSTATGQVGDGDASDAYQFVGRVTDVSAEGDLSNATFILNGEEVSPGDLPDATANGSSMVAQAVVPVIADGSA